MKTFIKWMKGLWDEYTECAYACYTSGNIGNKAGFFFLTVMTLIAAIGALILLGLIITSIPFISLGVALTLYLIYKFNVFASDCYKKKLDNSMNQRNNKNQGENTNA